MLYAVLRGSAEVSIGGERLRLRAHTGVWVPAGDLVAVRPSPGAVVLPLPVSGGGRTVATRLSVPEHAHTSLLHAFVDVLGHLDGADGPAQFELTGDSPEPLAAPPAPVSPELRALAELLTRGSETGLAEAVGSAAPGWSVRTVQRRFQSETGWGIAAWARRQRVRAAADMLAEGRDIEWVAHRVGYGGVPAFSRAFSEATGATPGQWRQRSADACMRVSAPGLGRTRPGSGGEAGARPGAAPERRTWTRVNGAHVAVWAARGGAQLIVGGRELSLAEGDAVIIPAGTPNEFRTPAGSLLVPLGFRSARTGAIGAPVKPAAIGSLWEGGLLEAVLASYTRVGVVGVDPDRGFAATIAGSVRAAVTPDDALLGAAANLFAREPDLRLGVAATRLGVSEREFARVIHERTGESPAAWLRLLRMTRARNQLGDGETPSEISRELGYAHLPAFSRAFRAVHGAGPTVLGVPNLKPTRAAWGRSMRVPASAL
ncbi:AraC-like DNA-binding protein [Leucobacter komagatae]|uniref:AraC-like DNA-binding protein n=2 Tax=Leucobacter komagatae TaxID=55969 RepID=A0A542Y464_9MICO|nr:AraC-like DNA-binding protein [Leucobacter komagatae]